MNTSEKVEEIDYEPDVLRFKKIWDEMKETQQDKSQSANTATRQSKPKTIKENQGAQKPKDKPIKKQAVMSTKNVQRNPKHNPEMVIQVVTNPLGFHNNEFQNQKNRVNKETLLQIAPDGNEHKTISDIRNLESQLSQKDYQLSLLRVSNTRSEDRIRFLQQEITQRDKKIFELESKQRQLIGKNGQGLDKQRVFDYGKVQYQNFKNDSKRLLKMLQSTDEYQTFANLALDDNGVRFLHNVNQKVKGALDIKNTTKLHFCTCNKDFIPESSFWVPQKVHSYGKQFIKERNGQLTVAELELLLYDLNKIWREREKRIINTITSQKSKQIGQLKRKIQTNKHHSKQQ